MERGLDSPVFADFVKHASGIEVTQIADIVPTLARRNAVRPHHKIPLTIYLPEPVRRIREPKPNATLRRPPTEHSVIGLVVLETVG